MRVLPPLLPLPRGRCPGRGVRGDPRCAGGAESLGPELAKDHQTSGLLWGRRCAGDIAAFHNCHAPEVRTRGDDSLPDLPEACFRWAFQKKKDFGWRADLSLGQNTPKKGDDNYELIPLSDTLTSTWAEVSEGVSQYWTVEQIFQWERESRSIGH